MTACRVLVGGDVAPGGRNLPFFLAGDRRALLNDLLGEFESAHLSVVDLECPLTDSLHPIPKSGPHLAAPRGCVRGLTFTRILNLANNHVMDHGEEGLASTLDAAGACGLDVVGAGRDLAEAAAPLVRNVGGLTVGILAITQRDASAAGPDRAGANPIDVFGNARAVRILRNGVDYLIVLLHGGVEHYPFPTPWFQRYCRFLVEEGADAVIGQHTHCPGCMEEYLGGTIVYGQGNLLFDLGEGRPEGWYRGFLVALDVHGPRRATVEIIPYVQSLGGVGARRMDGAAERVFRSELEGRSSRIQDEAFVRLEFERYCRARRDKYLGLLYRDPWIVRMLNHKLHISSKLHVRNSRVKLLHLIRCEPLKEILEEVLSC